MTGFVNSKLKVKDIWKLCPAEIHKSTIYNHYNRIQENWTNGR